MEHADGPDRRDCSYSPCQRFRRHDADWSWLTDFIGRLPVMSLTMRSARGHQRVRALECGETNRSHSETRRADALEVQHRNVSACSAGATSGCSRKRRTTEKRSICEEPSTPMNAAWSSISTNTTARQQPAAPLSAAEAKEATRSRADHRALVVLAACERARNWRRGGRVAERDLAAAPCNSTRTVATRTRRIASRRRSDVAIDVAKLSAGADARCASAWTLVSSQLVSRIDAAESRNRVFLSKTPEVQEERNASTRSTPPPLPARIKPSLRATSATPRAAAARRTECRRCGNIRARPAYRCGR